MFLNLNKERLKVVNLSDNNRNSATIAGAFQEDSTARIFSHPFFQEDDSKYTQYPEMSRFRQSRDESLQECLKLNQPLIILEQIHRFEQLKAHLKQFGNTGDVYVFLTPYFDPTPISYDYFQNKQLLRELINDHYPINDPLSRTFHLKKNCWDNFAQILKSAPITFIELGGQCLAFYDEKDLDNPHFPDIRALKEVMKAPGNGRFMINHKVEDTLMPEYCVGTTAIELLQRGFDVSISLPSWPNGLWREDSLLFP